MWPVQLLLQTIRSPAAAHEEDAQGNRKLVKTSSSDYIEPAIISFLFMLTENKFLGCSYCPNSSIMRQKSDLIPLHLHIIKQAEDVYESYSWLHLMALFPPIFTPLFSCHSSSVPTYGTDWLTESLMIHHAERSTRQRASGQITSNFQFRESCIYQTDFTLALSQKYHFWDLLWLV